mgnify:CR=1 FL=1
MFQNRISQGRADVPVRIRGIVVEVRVRDAAVRTVVGVAATNRHTSRRRKAIDHLRGKHPPLASQFTLSGEWFTRQGRADVPVRIRGIAVEGRVRDAAGRTVGGVAATKRHTSAAVIKPETITIILRRTRIIRIRIFREYAVFVEALLI